MTLLLEPQNTQLRIDEVYVFVSSDETGEGVCAMVRDGLAVPLIAADEARMKSLLPIARLIAKESGKQVADQADRADGADDDRAGRNNHAMIEEAMMRKEFRALIVEWVRANDCRGNWLVHLYVHLTGHGASPDDAIEAMERFVDESIAKKAQAYGPLSEAAAENAKNHVEGDSAEFAGVCDRWPAGHDPRQLRSDA